jgi:hypothetical protein
LGLAALDRTAPPGQRPDSTSPMRVDAATDRGSQLKDGTGSTGLGFKTRTHLAPDLVNKSIPFRGASARYHADVSIHRLVEYALDSQPKSRA